MELKKIFIFCFFIICFSKPLFAQDEGLPTGDFTIVNPSGYTMDIKIEANSLPFEGMTYFGQSPSISDYNRHQIQNGNIWRMYFNSNQTTFTQYDSIYRYMCTLSSGTRLDLAHCNGWEDPVHSLTQEVYGFAKYLITIRVYNLSINETFKFYYNLLDSKYGNNVDDYLLGDLALHYEPVTIDHSARLKFSRTTSSGFLFGYIYTTDNPTQEFKIWKMYNDEHAEDIGFVPVVPTREFSINTTPIGFDPEFFSNNKLMKLKLELR